MIGNSCQEAFEKTIDEVGFQPYSSFQSFASLRAKIRKERKRISRRIK